jgi:hypothetical protein
MSRKMKVSVMVVMFIMCVGFDFSQDSTEPAKTGGAVFTVTKLAVGTGVENRELVGEAQAFPAATEKVYCFLDAANIAADIQVVFVWFQNDKEVNRTTLNLRQGSRWRTWANKTVTDKKGDWKVELQDVTGAVIGSTAFKVE